MKEYAPYRESIFFPLGVAPMTIENNFEGHKIEKPSNLNYANMSVLKFDAANI